MQPPLHEVELVWSLLFRCVCRFRCYSWLSWNRNDELRVPGGDSDHPLVGGHRDDGTKVPATRSARLRDMVRVPELANLLGSKVCRKELVKVQDGI